MIDKRLRFEDSHSYFACPVCQNPLEKVQNSLKCLNNHTFDLSKFGYVNLLGGKKVDDHYSKESFENRQLVLENGFYDHILEGVQSILVSLPNHQSILDVGCGEGYYSRQLIHQLDKDFLAFDISKDSVQIAAKSDDSRLVKWFVSDLACLPIQNESIDLILDIFSPANYAEFKRILSEDGCVIKVIPTEHHVKELRALVQEDLKETGYSNQKIKDHFAESLEIIEEKEVTATYKCTDQQRDAFVQMTPLLFHVDKEKVDFSSITEITVSADILIGRAK